MDIIQEEINNLVKNDKEFLNNNNIDKDTMNISITKELLDIYNEKSILYKEINSKLVKRQIRNENFPSEISENIAKYALYKYYKIFGSWEVSSGDLVFLNKKVEVKGFMSSGPSSFGPNETWDILCFVDSSKHLNNFFTVYLFNISSIDNKWLNMKVNKKETIKMQSSNKRRPRITFNKIKKHLINDYKIIFQGTIEEFFE